MHSRRAEILQAAAALFASKGYHETTMDDIAAAVGIQKATLYSYIAGKQALLSQLFAQMFQYPLEVARHVTSLPVTPREKLRQFVFKYVAEMLERQELLTLFFRERRRLPAAQQEPLLAAARELEGCIDQIIREGQERGYFRDLNPLVMRQSLFGMINWTAEWYRPDGPLSPMAVADAMVDMLLWGWSQPTQPGLR